MAFLCVHQVADRLPPQNMLLNEFAHNPLFLTIHLLLGKIPKKDVFFFTMMGPVGINSDEINCVVDEHWVDLLRFSNTHGLLLYQCEHSFNEAVFDHQWGSRPHGPCLLSRWCRSAESS